MTKPAIPHSCGIPSDNVRFRISMLAAVALAALSMPSGLAADEIRGKVVEVSGESVTITTTSELVPNAGDPVTIVYLLPEINEEATVATGRVSKAGSDVIFARITSATGDVADGHVARISSEKPRQRTDTLPLRTTPGESVSQQEQTSWLAASIYSVNPVIAKKAGLNESGGALITGVFPSGAADRAGLQPGDIVLQLNSEKVIGRPDLTDRLAELTVGEKAMLTIYRDGERREVEVTLTARPALSLIDDMVSDQAEEGHAWAQYLDALRYYHGQRLQPDLAKAASLFHLAAAQNHDDAQRYLASMYWSGQGVAQDKSLAVKWFTRSAELGNMYAQFGLGGMYQHGLSVPQDYQQAVKWYHESAKQGVPDAQCALAAMIGLGNGVRQDYEISAAWYRLAAKQGSADAEFNLGLLHQYGHGVPHDLSKAREFYLTAADKGHVSAQNNLGYLYMYGKGVEIDYKTAMQWFQLSAQQRNPEAQVNIGVLYLNGWGVPQNKVEAVAWFIKAADQGNEVAKSHLKALGLKY